MEIGVTFPQNKIGADPFVIRDYAQAVEGLGYSHLLVYEHILGIDPTHRPGWQGFTRQDMFHEPFVLLGYLAALTHLELVPSVIILPQRQTALVAKQAAEVDILSGGKLRLGVGVGWIPEEFESLGIDYHARGRVIEEQIEILRLLWSRECRFVPDARILRCAQNDRWDGLNIATLAIPHKALQAKGCPAFQQVQPLTAHLYETLRL